MIASDAAGSAGDVQANAANNAAATQLQMFNTINQQQAPWRQSGQNALGAINSGFGFGNTSALDQQIAALGQHRDRSQDELYASLIAQRDAINAGTAQGPQTGGINAGQFTHTFTADDLNSNLAPNYQFQLQQGLGATHNAANLQTGLSGNTLRGLNDYAQNFAGNAYQQAFNNYNAQQTNIFNRLSNIAGLGQTANQTSATAGTAAGQGIGNAQMAAGAANAAGIVGGANALTQGGSNALGWYTLNNLTGGGGFDINDPNLVYQN